MSRLLQEPWYITVVHHRKLQSFREKSKGFSYMEGDTLLHGCAASHLKSTGSQSERLAAVCKSDEFSKFSAFATPGHQIAEMLTRVRLCPMSSAHRMCMSRVTSLLGQPDTWVQRLDGIDNGVNNFSPRNETELYDWSTTARSAKGPASGARCNSCNNT